MYIKLLPMRTGRQALFSKVSLPTTPWYPRQTTLGVSPIPPFDSSKTLEREEAQRLRLLVPESAFVVVETQCYEHLRKTTTS